MFVSAFSTSSHATEVGFQKYQEEGEQICSLFFYESGNTFVELTDDWREESLKFLAYVEAPNGRWNSDPSAPSLTLRFTVSFVDGERFERRAIIDDQSGRPYILLPPQIVQKLIALPIWTVSVDGQYVMSVNASSSLSEAKRFIECATEWLTQPVQWTRQ